MHANQTEATIANPSSNKSPHSHVPYGADGSGYYSNNASICYKAILESVPLALDVIKSATVEPGSVFTIADYGCADGGSSMPLWYACVQELRKIYGDDLPIHVIYEDQPINDFKSLFLRLQGFMPGTKRYLADFPNVFVTACGTNFYDQCLPPQSVNLAFTATAMHWLRDKPRDVPGASMHIMAKDPETAEKLKKQAAEDWELLLLQRAKELVPGGRMILVELAIDKEGQLLGVTKATQASVFDTLRDLWQGLVTDGFITQDEFDQTFFAFRIRTVDELKKPFESEDSAVRKAGLSLVSIETKLVPCPHKEKWLKDGGDPAEHARWYLPTIRRWSNATFIDGGGRVYLCFVMSCGFLHMLLLLFFSRSVCFTITGRETEDCGYAV
ncbi:uncharacterized protein LOC144662597 isoform X2 [Oculina patagonica]